MLKKDEQEITGIPPQALPGNPAPVSEPIPGIDFDFPDEIDPADLEPLPLHIPPRRHLIAIGIGIAALLLLALVPPLVNVSRYRRQIASSIGASLGRPVRMDKVSLNLLPVPSFTLEDFIVGEDPAFGTEPVIRANEVRATIRAASLWRGRVEFSSISLTDPSVNLVHLPDGRWEYRGHPAAGLACARRADRSKGRHPGPALSLHRGYRRPRQPQDEPGEVAPLAHGSSPGPVAAEPNEWRLRLAGKPARTDTAATDTGEFRIEGSLGRASSLAQMAVALDGSWTAAPLGAASWLILGRDAGLRGSMTLLTTVHGTIGSNDVTARLELRDLHRADFAPAHMLDADIGCTGTSAALFHRLKKIHCAWPPAATSGARFAADASFPDLTQPASFAGNIRWDDVPMASVLDTLRTASPRLPADLTVAGTLSGTAIFGQSTDAPTQANRLSLLISDPSFAAGKAPPFLAGPEDLSAESADGKLLSSAIPLDLGGPVPAVLDVEADRSGLTLHLTGQVLRSRLAALAAAVPQFGDGIAAILPPNPEPRAEPETPFRIDATAVRPWSGPQTWTIVAKTPAKPARRKSRR